MDFQYLMLNKDGFPKGFYQDDSTSTEQSHWLTQQGKENRPGTDELQACNLE